jgi:hypothetical protein
MNISKINILIFWCLLHVSKPRVHLQEDGCINSYDMIRFTCISISSLVGKGVCLILVVYSFIYNRPPENEISGFKYVEDIKKLK